MDDILCFPHAPVARADIRALRRLSNRPGLIRLAGHLGALLAAALPVALAPTPLLRLPAQAVEGAILVFLFCGLHESVHRTAFKSRRLDDSVAAVIGLLLLLPAGYFRLFHFAHHRYTQDPDRDPELSKPKPRTKVQWLWVVSGLPLWRDLISGLLRHAAGRTPEPFISPNATKSIVQEARAHLLLYALIVGLSLAWRSGVALEFWIVPALLGQPWLRLYLLAEHTGCPLVPDMLANSRTTLTNGVVRFFAWNMPFHSEHHVFPAVPFHALPTLHTHLARAIANKAPGYIAVSRRILSELT
jgi:fatty acid desaturase